MNYLDLSPEELHTTLRAAKMAAMADGTLADRERSLMTAATAALGLPLDIDAVQPITPEQAAASLPDPAARTRLIQAQLIMAMIDGDIGESELAVIRAFGKALNVEEPRLRNLQQYLDGHFKIIKFDLSRRSQMVMDVVKDQWRRHGLRGVWHSLGPFYNMSTDPELAWRCKELGLLPQGTLGRAYWEHMTQRRFTLPGEPGAFPEAFMKHDLCHTLGDYDTDSAGECEVVAFISGFMKSDPFWYLFMITMHMHLGIETFEKTPTARLALDPVRVANALRRGSQVNTDIYDVNMQWWPLFDRPLDEVRKRFNILPKQGEQS